MQFQTHPQVAKYMARLLSPFDNAYILEPTPGKGALIRAVKRIQPKCHFTAPRDFWKLAASGKQSYFDYAIMNPPFTPMSEGFRYLQEVMTMTDEIVALMPWFTVINSERRLEKLQDFGITSITHIPRKAFPGSRVQCCILHLHNRYSSPRPVTVFKSFTW